jgi:hypothetical protein
MRTVNILHTMPPEMSPSTRRAMSDFFLGSSSCPFHTTGANATRGMSSIALAFKRYSKTAVPCV